MDTNNEINDIAVFKIVNRLTYSSSTFNYDAAFEELKKIKETISLENNLGNW